VISPLQRPLPIQDNTDEDKHNALSRIRTHDHSDKAIKTYVSDHAATVTGEQRLGTVYNWLTMETNGELL
jgi:hypothetical protein